MTAQHTYIKRNLGYETGQTEPGLVAFYDIWPGNGVGLFLKSQSPHGACSMAVLSTKYLPPLRRLCFCLCAFVCQQHNSKSCGQILIKCFGGGGCVTGNSWLMAVIWIVIWYKKLLKEFQPSRIVCITRFLCDLCCLGEGVMVSECYYSSQVMDLWTNSGNWIVKITMYNSKTCL